MRRLEASRIRPSTIQERTGATLNALRRWWIAGRHYHPEQRYMRGGPPLSHS